MTAIAYEPDPALSFWPTPPEVAHDLVYLSLQTWCGLGDGIRVLEPSAGAGHLAREIRAHLPRAHITCIEPSPERAAALQDLRDAPTCGEMAPEIALPPYRGLVADAVHAVTLESYLADNALQPLAGQWAPYDLVIMNPPFTLDGRREAWAEHVLAVANDPHLVADGGIVAAVVPHVVLTGTSRRVRAVRDLAYDITPCERGAFDPVGAKVSTALVWIEKTGHATH